MKIERKTLPDGRRMIAAYGKGIGIAEILREDDDEEETERRMRGEITRYENRNGGRVPHDGKGKGRKRNGQPGEGSSL